MLLLLLLLLFSRFLDKLSCCGCSKRLFFGFARLFLLRISKECVCVCAMPMHPCHSSPVTCTQVLWMWTMLCISSPATLFPPPPCKTLTWGSQSQKHSLCGERFPLSSLPDDFFLSSPSVFPTAWPSFSPCEIAICT